MYFGTQAIVAEKKLDNGQLEVTLEPLKVDKEDGMVNEIRVVNEEAFRALLTEEPDDTSLTIMRDRLYAPVVAELMDVLTRHNVRVIDIEYFSAKISHIVQAMELMAIEKALGCSQYHRSLKDIQLED